MANKLTMIYNKTAATYNRVQVFTEKTGMQTAQQCPNSKNYATTARRQRQLELRIIVQQLIVPYIYLAEEIKSHR